MAVRFQCPGCSQPIEIDDEWAGKAVACPYCRRTVTAPTESTLADLSAVPVAAPVAISGPAPGASYEAAADPDADTNPLALTAFVLAGVMFACVVALSVLAGAYAGEYTDLERELRESGDPSSQMNAVFEYVRRHGGRIPAWMAVMVVCEIGGVLAGIAAFVCAALALRRRAHRALAIIALVSCGTVALYFVIGMIAAFASVPPRG